MKRSCSNGAFVKTPVTPAEWQEAVDIAHGALVLDAARLYGLVTGGPIVDVARCIEIIEQGRQRKIFPSHGAIERFAAALTRES
jgi:hypothetical protein